MVAVQMKAATELTTQLPGETAHDSLLPNLSFCNRGGRNYEITANKVDHDLAYLRKRFALQSCSAARDGVDSNSAYLCGNADVHPVEGCY